MSSPTSASPLTSPTLISNTTTSSTSATSTITTQIEQRETRRGKPKRTRQTSTSPWRQQQHQQSSSTPKKRAKASSAQSAQSVLSQKKPKKSIRRQLAELASERHVDLTTPNSILTQLDLRALINTHTFERLPMTHRVALAKLLPECDRAAFVASNNLTPSALNNEFIKNSCVEWQKCLAAGLFVNNSPPTLSNIDDDKNDADIDIGVDNNGNEFDERLSAKIINSKNNKIRIKINKVRLRTATVHDSDVDETTPIIGFDESLNEHFVSSNGSSNNINKLNSEDHVYRPVNVNYDANDNENDINESGSDEASGIEFNENAADDVAETNELDNDEYTHYINESNSDFDDNDGDGDGDLYDVDEQEVDDADDDGDDVDIDEDYEEELNDDDDDVNVEIELKPRKRKNNNSNKFNNSSNNRISSNLSSANGATAASAAAATTAATTTITLRKSLRNRKIKSYNDDEYLTTTINNNNININNGSNANSNEAKSIHAQAKSELIFIPKITLNPCSETSSLSSTSNNNNNIANSNTLGESKAKIRVKRPSSTTIRSTLSANSSQSVASLLSQNQQQRSGNARVTRSTAAKLNTSSSSSLNNSTLNTTSASLNESFDVNVNVNETPKITNTIHNLTNNNNNNNNTNININNVNNVCMSTSSSLSQNKNQCNESESGNESKTKTLAQIKAQLAEKKRLAAARSTNPNPNPTNSNNNNSTSTQSISCNNIINSNIKNTLDVKTEPITNSLNNSLIDELNETNLLMNTKLGDYLNEYIDEKGGIAIDEDDITEMFNPSVNLNTLNATISSTPSHKISPHHHHHHNQHHMNTKESSDIQKIVHELKLIGGTTTNTTNNNVPHNLNNNLNMNNSFSNAPKTHQIEQIQYQSLATLTPMSQLVPQMSASMHQTNVLVHPQASMSHSTPRPSPIPTPHDPSKTLQNKLPSIMNIINVKNVSAAPQPKRELDPISHHLPSINTFAASTAPSSTPTPTISNNNNNNQSMILTQQSSHHQHPAPSALIMQPHQYTPNKLITTETALTSTNPSTNGLINFIQSLPIDANFKLLQTTSSSCSSSPTNSSNSPIQSPPNVSQASQMHFTSLNRSTQSPNANPNQQQHHQQQKQQQHTILPILNQNAIITSPASSVKITAPTPLITASPAASKSQSRSNSLKLNTIANNSNNSTTTMPSEPATSPVTTSASTITTATTTNTQSSNQQQQSRSSHRSSNHQLTVAQLLSQKQQQLTINRQPPPSNNNNTNNNNNNTNTNNNNNLINSNQTTTVSSTATILKKPQQAMIAQNNQQQQQQQVQLTSQTQLSSQAPTVTHLPKIANEIDTSSSINSSSSSNNNNNEQKAIFAQSFITLNGCAGGDGVVTLQLATAPQLPLSIGANSGASAPTSANNTAAVAASQQTTQQSPVILLELPTAANSAQISNNASNSTSSSSIGGVDGSLGIGAEQQLQQKNEKKDCECALRPMIECLKCFNFFHESCINVETKICDNCRATEIS